MRSKLNFILLAFSLITGTTLAEPCHNIFETLLKSALKNFKELNKKPDPIDKEYSNHDYLEMDKKSSKPNYNPSTQYYNPSTQSELSRYLKNTFGLIPEIMTNVKKAKPIADEPIEYFYVGLPPVAINYMSLPKSMRESSNGFPITFFGKALSKKSIEERVEYVRNYFQNGIARSGGHFNISRHQDTVSGAVKSGFSNGTEDYLIAKNFCEGNGVIFIQDTTGQDLINVSKVTQKFESEKELLTKGGRCPTRIVGAVIYDNHLPIRYLLNPNYKER